MDAEMQKIPGLQDTDTNDINARNASNSTADFIPDGGLVAWTQVLMGIPISGSGIGEAAMLTGLSYTKLI